MKAKIYNDNRELEGTVTLPAKLAKALSTSRWSAKVGKKELGLDGQALGRKGGQSRSKLKTAASRRNGLKGGRPKKGKKGKSSSDSSKRIEETTVDPHWKALGQRLNQIEIITRWPDALAPNDSCQWEMHGVTFRAGNGDYYLTLEINAAFGEISSVCIIELQRMIRGGSSTPEPPTAKILRDGAGTNLADDTDVQKVLQGSLEPFWDRVEEWIRGGGEFEPPRSAVGTDAEEEVRMVDPKNLPLLRKTFDEWVREAQPVLRWYLRAIHTTRGQRRGPDSIQEHSPRTAAGAAARLHVFHQAISKP